MDLPLDKTVENQYWAAPPGHRAIGGRRGPSWAAGLGPLGLRAAGLPGRRAVAGRWAAGLFLPFQNWWLLVHFMPQKRSDKPIEHVISFWL